MYEIPPEAKPALAKCKARYDPSRVHHEFIAAVVELYAIAHARDPRTARRAVAEWLGIHYATACAYLRIAGNSSLLTRDARHYLKV
ncbi:hypothetical protein ACWDR0_10545 [Streptomyces sp. NPDC003691]